MKKVLKWVLGSVVLATLIYIFSPGLSHLIKNPSGWNLQAQFMYFTGICTMTLMILSMLISLRIPKLNSIFEGLDKAYLVHKWTGIFTTAFVVIHWLGDKIPLVLVKLNIVPDPEALIDINEYTKSEIVLYKSGTLLAELLFYVFIFLIVVSLYTIISYSFFRKTHKFIPAVFLIYAYHGATAPLKDHWYKDPGVFVVLILIGIGSMVALIAVFQQIGKSRKVKTVIKSIEQHQSGIIDIHLETVNKPLHHQPGQFAFLQFENSKEPHPFTIASSGIDPNVLRFCIKGLGDFTTGLQATIKVGQKVIVEGPYGEFKFDDACQQQIWIAGGIGITPFIARLDYLSTHGGAKKTIDFWYCTNGELESQFPVSLKELCNKAGVNLYHLNANKKELFSIDMLKDKFGSLETSNIWFCGPLPLKTSIDKDLQLHRFNTRNFHFDNFSMR